MIGYCGHYPDFKMHIRPNKDLLVKKCSKTDTIEEINVILII